MNIAMELIGSANAAGDMGHMGDYMMYGWNIWFWILGTWIILAAIAFLVYLDARDRGMNGLLWFTLVILPMIGLAFLIAYLIARDDRYEYEMSRMSPEAILNRRYARGDITADEYWQMKKSMMEENPHE